MVKNIGRIISISLVVFLYGCTLPGMHMTTPNNFSETINPENKIIKPVMLEINAKLVLDQKTNSYNRLKKRIENYKTPRGFTTQKDTYEYVIGKQDQLSIVIWDYKHLTEPHGNFRNDSLQEGFTVNNAGEIFYPYIGYVKVKGLTITQARDLLAQKLSKYVKDPQITLRVISFNSKKVNIFGSVKNQTSVPITNVPVTVLDALDAAGGMIKCTNSITNNTSSIECADTKHVSVKQGEFETVVDGNTLVSVTGSSENWVLSDTSTIYVPNNSLYRVYILGDVQRSGIYNMLQENMKLSDAVAAAGGVAIGSAPQFTYVVRHYGGVPTVYHINLRSPDAMLLANQFTLKPKDIVFISSSALKNMSEVLQYITPLLSTFLSTTALAVSISK